MNTIALLGQPNSGKSTVFNQLTGSRQHVGNWPGKTVEKKDGRYTYNGTKYTVVDLPGSYGLTGNSDEETVTEDYIKAGKADLVCILVDASQLERSMYMVADFASMDVPAVLLLNMMDVAAAQKKEIDDQLLSQRLGIPVLKFTAAEQKGYAGLKELFEKELGVPHKITSAPSLESEASKDAEPDKLITDGNSKFEWIESILSGVTKTAATDYKVSKLDRLMLRPVLGKIISIGVILAAFMVAMMICIPFMSVAAMIPAALGGPIAHFLTGLNVHPWLVSIFSLIIPNTLYFCIAMASFIFGINFVFAFLEEVGFLARTAYQFDGLLSKLGLQGKAVAPILMGFGCTMGGATGSRVMDNWGQKILTMMVVWAVPCASIWAIIPVISSMFFPAWGTMLICLGILVYMVILMWIVSKIFRRRLVPVTEGSGMIMELPPYHKAHWKHIIKEAWNKSFDMFLRALRTVTLVSLIFWVFCYSSTGNIENSLLYKVGTAIEPVTMFFGMSWKTFMAFLSSAFAKEAVLGTLNAIFNRSDSLVDATFNAKTSGVDASLLADSLSAGISKAEALAFMFACTFNIPCLMALTTTYRESHSIKWTARVAGFYVGGALLLSCVVYHIANLFM